MSKPAHVHQGWSANSGPASPDGRVNETRLSNRTFRRRNAGGDTSNTRLHAHATGWHFGKTWGGQRCWQFGRARIRSYTRVEARNALRAES